MTEGCRPPPPPGQEATCAYIADTIGRLVPLAQTARLPSWTVTLLAGTAEAVRRPDIDEPHGGYSIAGDWALVPAHVRHRLDAHIGRGEVVGSFLTAVLENDLLNAVSRADDGTRARLRDILVFLHMDAPAGCWGSPEKVESWRAHQGFAGRPQLAAAFAPGSSE